MCVYVERATYSFRRSRKRGKERERERERERENGGEKVV